MTPAPLEPRRPKTDAVAGEVARHLRRRVEDVTTARLFLGRVDGGYRTETLLRLLAAQAVARDAVAKPLDLHQGQIGDLVASVGLYEVATEATSQAEHLANPQRGRRLSEGGCRLVRAHSSPPADVQFAVGDGLSAHAVHTQVPALLPGLMQACAEKGWSVGRPMAIRHCRVGVLADVGACTGADVVVLLIGERPGLGTADSLSAYAEWRPTPDHTDADRNVISNIHAAGLTPEIATRRIIGLLSEIAQARVSGVYLHAVAPNVVRRVELVARAAPKPPKEVRTEE
jgi:ethanolamine ammonia-lyase small subunit